MKTAIFFTLAAAREAWAKSLFTFVLANYFLEKNSNILLVDSGTDNPDVYKAHKEMGLANLACAINRLDSQNDWMDLSNLTWREIPGSSCHHQRRGPDKGKRPAKWRNVLGNAGNA